MIEKLIQIEQRQLTWDIGWTGNYIQLREWIWPEPKYRSNYSSIAELADDECKLVDALIKIEEIGYYWNIGYRAKREIELRISSDLTGLPYVKPELIFGCHAYTIDTDKIEEMIAGLPKLRSIYNE